jgi:hypothetical protein
VRSDRQGAPLTSYDQVHGQGTRLHGDPTEVGIEVAAVNVHPRLSFPSGERQVPPLASLPNENTVLPAMLGLVSADWSVSEYAWEAAGCWIFDLMISAASVSRSAG